MFQERTNNKKLIYDFSKSIGKLSNSSIDNFVSQYFHDNALWYGPHPINELKGSSSISNEFYKPLLNSFPDVQKNDVFLTGGIFAKDHNQNEWVSTMGNFVGTFEKDYLGIPATQNVVWIRFGEFNRIKDGKIVETRIILDLLDLIRQAGIKFINALGKEVFCPPPATLDGIFLGQADNNESDKTLKLVETMLYQGLKDDYHENGVYGMGMEKYFHKNFMWYGPGGTGTTRGLKGFLDYHCDPFCNGIPDWNGGNHLTRFAEGHFCSFVGWPSIYATHTGNGWLGLPATNKKITMRVMDFYRREGDLLVENWVFIDMIDFLLQVGIDVFDRLEKRLNIFESNVF
jgi:predicted ester cyclase